MEITKIFSGHLDLFKEVKRNEAQKLAIKTIFKGMQPPDYISVNFDFENKVVIFLNKKSQQTILVYGSSVGGKSP
jgi:hypothetical protein